MVVDYVLFQKFGQGSRTWIPVRSTACQFAQVVTLEKPRFNAKVDLLLKHGKRLLPVYRNGLSSFHYCNDGDNMILLSVEPSEIEAFVFTGASELTVSIYESAIVGTLQLGKYRRQSMPLHRDKFYRRCSPLV